MALSWAQRPREMWHGQGAHGSFRGQGIPGMMETSGTETEAWKKEGGETLGPDVKYHLATLLARNPESQIPLRTYGIRICIFT